MIQIEVQYFRDLLCSKTLVHACVRKEIAFLRMLVRHELVLWNVDQQENHADVFPFQAGF